MIVIARPPVGPLMANPEVTLICSSLHFTVSFIVQPSPYGEPVAPQAAPEAITKAVASLPPEQMFELMRQMKVHQITSCLLY